MGVGQKFSCQRKHPQKTPNISLVRPSLAHIFARKSAIFNKLALLHNFTPGISLERKILPRA
jgi:hypothetical protein